MRHLRIGKIKVNRESDYEKTVPIVINDIIVRMEPDSRADVNVMDKNQYQALKRKTYDTIRLDDSSVKLSTLQKELKVFGEFKATARNQTRGAETTFIIVKGKILFVLRFYGPVNPMGSCRAWSVYLTTRLLGRLSPLSG